MIEKCFLCGRALPKSRQQADTRDDQIVLVGRDCYRKIEAAGEAGYPTSPRPGYVRLYPTRQEVTP
jgi:hypothetical protein